MMAARAPFRLRWPHYLLAVLVYLTLLLAWTPASLLAWALPQLTHQTVWLDQAQGSVWCGEAAGVRVQAATGPELQLGHLSWQLKPFDFFTGRLGYQLKLGGVGIDAEGALRAGVKDVVLSEVRAELPASMLERVSPDLALWQPGGHLVLETNRLVFKREGVGGEATLIWRDAVSGRLRLSLGSYRTDIEGTGNTLGLELTTESGPLFLQGSGKWNHQRGMTFNGTARVAPDHQTEMDELLGLIGPADADGSRAIRIGR
jgi:general secretion pathway protein N